MSSDQRCAGDRACEAVGGLRERLFFSFLARGQQFCCRDAPFVFLQALVVDIHVICIAGRIEQTLCRRALSFGHCRWSYDRCCLRGADHRMLGSRSKEILNPDGRGT